MQIYLKMPLAFLHPFINLFSPLWGRIQALRGKDRQIFSPEVAARLEDLLEEIGNMMDWLLQQYRDFRQTQDVINCQLDINFTAIHSLAVVIVKIMFASAEGWNDYALALIEDLEQALKESGGAITMDRSNKLFKLDISMEETFRHSLITASNFAPWMPANTELLNDNFVVDGTFLPKGRRFAMAAESLSIFPSVYEQSNGFRGFRFATSRGPSASPQVELYTNSSLHGMLSGHGR
ncbi:hypothetical protein P153DRAFT_404999 [Dothidotthia symphoricarpi CBS 119687]|uniref:Cytochrome P450 n=1 Tax=Dothidotthia symphoricarpi CBS 119687 TaxID=1392245 RepID=A0A6A6A9I0_9PLEO|nr:uncharacterized protein P153DRAFT_404999 [Dothidotthia symphoricarpi CBS 119687]KAF2127853.1 hypothetical protein P153DRAFT_404999 [Dothidotthia symphoricarpi CBS 119687]